MDRLPENTCRHHRAPPLPGKPHLVMGYYDGNTVTASWNYPQH